MDDILQMSSSPAGAALVTSWQGSSIPECDVMLVRRLTVSWRARHSGVTAAWQRCGHCARQTCKRCLTMVEMESAILEEGAHCPSPCRKSTFLVVTACTLTLSKSMKDLESSCLHLQSKDLYLTHCIMLRIIDRNPAPFRSEYFALHFEQQRQTSLTCLLRWVTLITADTRLMSPDDMLDSLSMSLPTGSWHWSLYFVPLFIESTRKRTRTIK